MTSLNVPLRSKIYPSCKTYKGHSIKLAAAKPQEFFFMQAVKQLHMLDTYEKNKANQNKKTNWFSWVEHLASYFETLYL